MLQRIGLYYPYVNFRDERWLKTAALYWPQMARIVREGCLLGAPQLVRMLTAT
ncbi:hypothetical protein [Streptomyces lutosisoli]|uniref:Uncharacterized protein n=1 Tax=Streptomyces lutosisoli TaxID=2665721 RepID=A0ABW2VWB5_9ACTN